MYADEDLIPISALQHYLFCPRQCAFIHVDGLWAENRLTVEGKALHERVDTPGFRTRGMGDERVRRVRALPLINRRIGLTGKADTVEFSVDCPPKPVEYKRGKPKRLDHDRVQVAAQALCLEEMLGVTIETAEIFYHAVRHREEVPISATLRQKIERLTAEVRATIEQNLVPTAKKQAKCKNCSLLHLCLPAGTGPTRDPARYLRSSLGAALTGE